MCILLGEVCFVMAYIAFYSILALSYVLQIFEFIVKPIIVNVIYHMFWPFAITIQPCKPVRVVYNSVYTYKYVP